MKVKRIVVNGREYEIKAQAEFSDEGQRELLLHLTSPNGDDVFLAIEFEEEEKEG